MIDNFGGKGSTEFFGVCCLVVNCRESALPVSWLQVDVCFLGLQRSSRVDKLLSWKAMGSVELVSIQSL